VTAAIVFDLDDTLVDTYSVAQEKGRAVARQLGLAAPSPRQFAETYGSADFATCVQVWHPEIDVARYSQAYDDLAVLHQPRALCTIAPVLAAAQEQGYAVGILTNGPVRKTKRKLAALDADVDDFAFVLHGDDGPAPKPHVAAFHRLRTDAGVDLSTAWYVSDSPADWSAAQSVGMGTVGTPRPWGRTPAARVTAPHLMVRTVEDLVPVIPHLPSSPVLPTTPVAAISIDAGFTLIDHLVGPADVVIEAASRSGRRVDSADVSAAMERHRSLLADGAAVWASDDAASSALTRYYVAVLSDLEGPGQCADAMNDLARDVITRYVAPSNWVARPFARRLLERAATGGRRVGVLSNWQTSLASAVAHAGLFDLTDEVLPSSLVGAGKPSATPFLAMAESLGVAPPAMAHMGDDVVSDVGGSLRAGCPAIYAPSDSSWAQMASMLDAVT